MSTTLNRMKSFYAILFDVDAGNSFSNYCEGRDATAACHDLVRRRLHTTPDIAAVLIQEGKIEVIAVLDSPLGTDLTFAPTLGINQFPYK